MTIMEIIGASVFSILTFSFMVLLIFSESIALHFAVWQIRKMAELLPEAERERWLDEQGEGYINAKKKKRKK